MEYLSMAAAAGRHRKSALESVTFNTWRSLGGSGTVWDERERERESFYFSHLFLHFIFIFLLTSFVDFKIEVDIVIFAIKAHLY